MSYKIIDNLLSKSDIENIQNIMSGSDFPWFLHHKVKKDIVLDQKSEVYNFQFIHSFYNNEILTGIAILSVLYQVRELEISKALLVQPILSYRGVLSFVKKKN
jgi:hypothetical protein